MRTPFRRVRRRTREARHLGHPVRRVRWAVQVLVEDWRVLVAFLGGPR
jgi:hypothetical protein